MTGRYVLASWGIAGAGNRLSVHFKTFFSTLQLNTEAYNGNVFFWKHDRILAVQGIPGI
jgi:hypothetical protein